MTAAATSAQRRLFWKKKSLTKYQHIAHNAIVLTEYCFQPVPGRPLTQVLFFNRLQKVGSSTFIYLLRTLAKRRAEKKEEGSEGEGLVVHNFSSDVKKKVRQSRDKIAENIFLLFVELRSRGPKMRH